MSLFGTILLICLCVLLYFHSNDMHHRFDKLEEKLAKLDEQARPTDKKEPTEVRSAARAWDVRVATEKLAREKNERNREVKRRAKECKAAGIAERQKEQRLRDLALVAESLEHEQNLRNEVALAHGWPVHPNDVEDLTPKQQAEMLEAFRLKQPPPDFVSGSR